MTKPKKRPSMSNSNEEVGVECQGRYREHLVAARQAAQGEWDKATWMMAGGALATSLVFLKDIVGTKAPRASAWLMVGWAGLILSLAFVFASHALSFLTLSEAIEAHDAGRPDPQANRWRCATERSNIIASVLCWIGVLCVAVFAYLNFGA